MSKLSESDLILNKDGSVYHLNLLPKHITENIITVGDPSRVYRVSQYFDDIEFEMNKREFITHVGKFKGKPVTVISTGMGTDNIEIFFTELDALINVDLKTREVRGRKKSLRLCGSEHPLRCMKTFHWIHISSLSMPLALIV